MSIISEKKKYDIYVHKYALSEMPDRGYAITGWPDILGSKYTAFFKSKAQAIRAGQLLANCTREHVRLGQIQNHGNLRFTIGEITPDPI
jgi:hypothetical protein